MKILLKYPSRNRPELLRKNLTEYWDLCTDKDNTRILVSLDSDDEESIKVANEFDYIELHIGNSKNKIDACNRDVEKTDWPWDIIILCSDDMFCKLRGWDERLRDDMKRCFPDTDGCLWYHDGSKQKVISTLSVIGRKYYDRFGYIYHPSYKSFFCDNEYTEVATSENKIVFLNTVLFRHEHPNWGGGVKVDELYKRNDLYWNQDQENYNKRKREGFKI